VGYASEESSVNINVFLLMASHVRVSDKLLSGLAADNGLEVMIEN
jgi:hypothetical protein